MALRCSKCQEAEAFQGDSWCLACAAHEELGQELRQTWGTGGSRSIATDLIVSGLRQVRALRRHGLASFYRGAEEARASADKGAALERASCARSSGSRRSKEAAPLPAPVAVKKEEAEERSESSESESEEEDDKDEPAPAAAAKRKPEREATPEGPRLRSVAPGKREDLPRRREGEREASRSVHPLRSGAEPSREDRDRDRRREERRREKKDKGEHSGKRKRPGHRGGSRHQKLHKAAEEPYRRFHHRLPPAFWDEPRERF